MQFDDGKRVFGRRELLIGGAALTLPAASMASIAIAQEEAGEADSEPISFTMGAMMGEAYEALSSPLSINEQLYIQVLTSLELTNTSNKSVQLGILDRKLFKGFDSRAIFYGLQSASGIGEGEGMALVGTGQTARVVMQFISGRQDADSGNADRRFDWFDYSGTLVYAETAEELVNYSLGFRVPAASFG
ncbi:MAG: hypothetical protein GDA41_10940 [Rhodospirillales bacterium]|nr:hypothetical protein [Rhodospirillales bacterium]